MKVSKFRGIHQWFVFNLGYTSCMQSIVYRYNSKKSIEIYQIPYFLPYSIFYHISILLLKSFRLIFQQIEETPSQNLVRVILIIYTCDTPKMGLVLHCQHGKFSVCNLILFSSFGICILLFNIENEHFFSSNGTFDLIF